MFHCWLFHFKYNDETSNSGNVNHVRVRSWKQPVLIDECEMSCSRKQQEFMNWFKLTDIHRIRFMSPTSSLKDLLEYRVFTIKSRTTIYGLVPRIMLIICLLLNTNVTLVYDIPNTFSTGFFLQQVLVVRALLCNLKHYLKLVFIADDVVSINYLTNNDSFNISGYSI